MFELNNPPETTDQSVTLRATRGRPLPEGLSEDVGSLAALPTPIKKAFWEILAPYLGGIPDEQQQARISELCEKSKVALESLVRPIKGARFFITEAARAALDQAAFEADLAALCPGQQEEVIAVLWPCFERAQPVLARAIMARTLAEHGRLVENVHWRIDKVINSEHGDGINTPVAVLTFAYRDGSNAERVTLHLLPEQLHKLKVACQEMLP